MIGNDLYIKYLSYDEFNASFSEIKIPLEIKIIIEKYIDDKFGFFPDLSSIPDYN